MSRDYRQVLLFTFLIGCFEHASFSTTPTALSSSVIKFGAVFGKHEILQRIAFAHVVDSLNGMPRFSMLRTRFVPLVYTVSTSDSYKVTQKVCDLMLDQVVTIFGPAHESISQQAASLCEHKEIPHVSTRMTVDGNGHHSHVTKKIDNRDRSTSLRTYSVNLYPPSKSIGSVLVSLVKYYDWNSFIVLYEEDDGLVQLQELIHMSSMAQGPVVRTVQLNQGRFSNSGTMGTNMYDFKPLLKDVKNLLHEFHFVIQADLEASRLFMEQVKDMDMIGEYYHYIFTNLDVYTLDFETYKIGGCNVTTLTIVHPEVDVTEKWTVDLKSQLMQSNQPPMLPRTGIQTELAILHDSVMLMAESVKKLGPRSLVPRSMNCLDEQPWKNGSTFLNYIMSTEMHGITGKVEFRNGKRHNFVFTIMELSKNGFEMFGTWNVSNKLVVTKNYSKSIMEAEETLENQKLRVVVLLEEPFFVLKESANELTGNDRYEGFCVDLLEEIAKLKKFNYTIHEVKDKSYGVKTPSGKWNGMVGELVEKNADLAVGAFTINYGRSDVIDFTVPFMHLGISILFRKPKNPEPSLFSFLSPLSLDVWIYMLAAYIVVSLMLWLLARFSPYEWYNPHPCNPDSDVVENQFNLLNSFWFTVGSLMQQGSDIAPRATSTRLVSGVWWFFTLILISSYTANLAAFLTVERMVPQINGADDLVKQTKIKYGSLNRGSTMTFFKESKIGVYEKMWQFMETTQPSVFVSSTMEGIQRVQNEEYAFLMESAMIEYYTERKCDLIQVGSQLDSKGYGIGMRKGSVFRDVISSAILQLQENTMLTSLKERWWKQKRGGGKCVEATANQGQHNELGLKNVGGVFVLLLFGIGASLILAILEFMYKSAQLSEEEREPLWSSMIREARFAFLCNSASSKKQKNRRKSLKLKNPNIPSRSSSPSPVVGFLPEAGVGSREGTNDISMPSYRPGYTITTNSMEPVLPPSYNDTTKYYRKYFTEKPL